VKNPQGSHLRRSGQSPDFYSVQFADNNNGYIVGDQGLILASTDGGISWRSRRAGRMLSCFTSAFEVSGDGLWALRAHCFTLTMAGGAGIRSVRE
jgi:photosystem II stability/assembly factor-like uncharacterized protein